MPELPEVETTRAALAPELIGRRIHDITLRTEKLRRPLHAADFLPLREHTFTAVRRRGKYLLFDSDRPDLALLIHLGMSGTLRLVPATTALKPHDHVLITLGDKRQLRLHDPRRFGQFLAFNPQQEHPLLVGLGIEPLAEDFDGDYLYRQLQHRRSAVKTCLMNQRIVVGVGNIYAAEALFHSGILPQRPASLLTTTEAARLAENIKNELRRAIALGGTTLRDFFHPDGQPGYFAQTLAVYGREGQACPRCRSTIKSEVIGGRASCYCPQCQQ